MDINSVHNRIKSVLAVALCIIVTAIFVPITATQNAEAETVTDTLTVKVGYWGMKETDYVEKGTWHWTELQKNLAVKDENGDYAVVDYSFFRDKEDGTYSTIVSSARGIYLEDLLKYAGVNMSDIKNISFYTNDYTNGAFASFTPYQLLEQPRYYYDNLASHITNVRNGAGILTGYKLDSDVENFKQQVNTMLALESNWYTYEAGTQNTNPVHSGLGTSSRFRLLFGQSKADETGTTNKSAKYVHTIAITMPGSPVLKGNDYAGSGKIVLSNKLGKHTAKFTVAADEAMLDMIKSNLVWQSTDERVLKLGDISMQQSSQYNDAIEVTLNYEVLKEGGAASVSANFLGMDLSGSEIITGDEPTDDVKTEESKSDTDSNSDSKSNTEESESSTGSGSSPGKSSTSKGTSSKTSSTSQDRKLSLVSSGGSVTSAAADSAQAAPISDSSAASQTMYEMDLESVMNPDAKETVITQKDNSSRYIPGLCIGGGILLAAGGAASVLQFKSETTGLSFGRRRRG